MTARKTVAAPRKRERPVDFLGELAAEEEQLFELLARNESSRFDDGSLPELQLWVAVHWAVKEQLLYPAIAGAYRDAAHTDALARVRIRWDAIDALVEAAIRDPRDLRSVAAVMREQLEVLFEEERELVRGARKLNVEGLERKATHVRNEVRGSFADSMITPAGKLRV